jgi:FMN phosphatase YigB (HAD superfamily)
VISTLLFDAGGTLVTPNFRRMADEYARDGVAVDPERLARAEALARLDFERPDFVRSHPGDIWLSYMHDVARKAEVERPPLAAFERLRAYHDSDNLWEEPIFKVDVLGARAAGMRAVLIDPHGFHADKPCPRVASLSELSPAVFAGA